MRARLCAVFFLSGAAALAFENLWFRQAGLAFGNSVWASSLVLASFMAGLGLGNALAARFGRSVRRPVRLYAVLEIVVGVLGAAIVFALPGVGHALARLATAAGLPPAALNSLRFSASFLLLVAPAGAMGLTLPLLTRALMRTHPRFGENLGALYGWNTLGAVAGALLVETLLVTRLGVRGAALAAGSTSALAAALAWGLSRSAEGLVGDGGAAEERKAPPRLDGASRRLLGAAFLAGAILLALEVVWFRFLLMFCVGTSLAFAILLAVVLAGIGLGGLAASLALRRGLPAERHPATLFALAGLLVVATYAGFNGLLPRLGGLYFFDAPRILAMAAYLTFPVSLVSGMVFTLLGAALDERLRAATAAAGLLTLANTAGAMCGALGAGFVLLPRLGMERSFALLAAAYGVAGLLVLGATRRPEGRLEARLAVGLAAAYLAFLLLFPFGLMNAVYMRTPLLKLYREEAHILAVREGVLETALVVESRRHGEPLDRRLVTNGFSMSGTGWGARRYMGLYVFLPAALHPGLESALLISYGVGNTARALVSEPELGHVDVVDISPDVLALAPVFFPDPGTNPLADPRVSVHVEDGRAFLEATTRRYDLITSEPPPPRNAGVVNLYSQEYFELVRSRLREGGLVSYWLPVHVLGRTGTAVVVRAFCSAFPDCSLWSGYEYDWMLLGSRDGRGGAGEERLRRPWGVPALAAELGYVGLEAPEQLGALFLADAAGLRRLAEGAAPLTDNWPHRLGPIDPGSMRAFDALLDAGQARAAFAASPQIARWWPETLREPTLRAFEVQGLWNDVHRARVDAGTPVPLRRLHEAVRTGAPRSAVLVMLGSSPDEERAARAAAGRAEPGPDVLHPLAVSAFADRDYAGAVRLAREAAAAGHAGSSFLLAYALFLDGRAGEAAPLLAGLDPESRAFLAEA